MEENTTPETSNSNPMKFIIPVVIILVIGVVAFMMMKPKSATQTANTETTQTTEVAPTDAAMKAETSSPSGAMAEDTVTIEVSGDNFSFDKKEIKVKKGQKVTINFTNKEGFHDWVVDEFGAKTTRLAEGKSETITFTADKTGTFEYYCSVGSHRQMGMKGNLIVE